MSKYEVLRLDAKSSSKGQVTIPAEIRQMIGLKPGGSVQFVTDGEGGVRIVAKKRGLRHLMGILGPVDGPIDVDQAIEEAVWARNRPDRTEFDV